MKQTDTKKAKGILSSKWFYGILAFCLMASGVASWMAIESSAPDSPDTPPIASVPNDTQVNRPQTDVAKPDSSSSILPPGSVTEEEAPNETPAPSASQQGTQQTQVLFVMPANGDICNTYSGGQLVKSVTMGDWRTHDGIDIDCEEDRRVKAAGSGVVASVENDPLWGTTITITHDGGIVTYYSSLSADVAVAKGQKVSAGDVIGSASDSAAVEVLEPIHLHFAAKRDGQWIDPTTLFANGK